MVPIYALLRSIIVNAVSFFCLQNGVKWVRMTVFKLQRNRQTQKRNTFLSLTFFQAFFCSWFHLSTATLTRSADSLWQLAISRQCTSKHDLSWAHKVPLTGSRGALPRWLSRRPHIYKKVTPSCGGVRVEGREVQVICANETSLSVSGLHHWTKWKLECATCVQCLCCCAVWL